MNCNANEPILSICIATLNRSKFIGSTLESIVEQIDNSIEVVIVDGSSNELTDKIVHSFQDRGYAIQYHHLPVNGGVDQDYTRAVELARGRYCWLMTDDDILKKGAVEAVIAAIRQDFGLIVVNAEVRSGDMSEVIEARRLSFDRDREYGKGVAERFFVEVADYLSYIGCVVIRRDIWDERNKEKYFGTLFVHVGVIFQYPPIERIMVIANPLISIRYSNAMWSSRGFEIWTFKWPNLIWSFDNYSTEARRRVAQCEPWRKLRILLLHRALGAFSREEYRKMVKPRLSSLRERCVMRVIAEIPGVLANVIVITYLSLFYRKSRLPFADLRCSRFYYRNYLFGKIT